MGVNTDEAMYNSGALERTRITRIGSRYLTNFGQKWLFFITIELITGVLHGNGAHPFYY
jgi:hypothetical protein